MSVLLVDKLQIKNFYDSEAMAVACAPKYRSCCCVKYPVGNKLYTLKEERELHIVATMHMLRSTERSLSQNLDHTRMYSKQK